jgi:hypothetical protein
MIEFAEIIIKIIAYILQCFIVGALMIIVGKYLFKVVKAIFVYVRDIDKEEA